MCQAHYSRLLILFLASSAQILAAATPTTTTLAITSDGSISEGSFVTLVATVSNPAPVAQGTVYFCKSLISSCVNGQGTYGAAKLTAGGTAILRTRVNLGDNDVSAVFVATDKNLGSASPTIELGVAPRIVYPSSTSLSSSGGPGNYTLTGDVSSFGLEPMKGPVSLLNVTDNSSEIASASLSGPVIGLANAASYSVGSEPTAVATGDFNGDGIPDLVVANENNNNISVMLGNGDGTFQNQKTWSVGHTPESIVVGDFNGDGVSDLAVADTNSNCISILLGNGDGSFQNQVEYPVDRGPVSIGTGDFNRDGVADLVVANTTNADVTVLLGNGDGTFQEGSAFNTGRAPESLALGDFNSDGVVDLAVANSYDDTVSILIGNGDGTFQPQKTFVTGAVPYSIATADLNGDGTLDLVIANRFSNTVSILIGDGKGNFQNESPVATGTAPDAIVVGDFNGDGTPDIAVCNQFDSTVSVLLGNGNATFLPRQNYMMRFSNGLSLVAGDFNGDGLTDLANTDVAELNVQLGQQVASFSVSGILTGESGTSLILANYPGDNIRMPSQSSPVALSGVAGAATVSLFSAPNPAPFGAVITLSATVVGRSGVSPTGQVVFKDGTAILGTSGISGSTATITTAGLAVGIHSLTATYIGDSNYTAAISMPLMETISKAKSAIGLSSSVSPSVYGNAISLTATITKGATGSVLFMDGQSTIGSRAVNGDGQAVISTSTLAAGLHTITAIYSGDQNFE
jgi:hypothetical protein